MLAFIMAPGKLFEMHRYLDILLTFIIAVTLTIIMLWPLDQPPAVLEGSDKLAHFFAFAILSFPLARTGRVGLLPIFICASAFGYAIELIQPSFNRSSDIKDWVADIVGVLIGIASGLLCRRLPGR